MKNNNLPNLKVGQVWQCRDQTVTTKLIRPESNVYRSLGTSSITKRHIHDFVYGHDSSDATSYRVLSGCTHEHDLVQLLYDPDDEVGRDVQP